MIRVGRVILMGGCAMLRVVGWAILRVGWTVALEMEMAAAGVG